jgi:DNA-directed RNA polymerase subunit RPC12/RpoP
MTKCTLCGKEFTVAKRYLVSTHPMSGVDHYECPHCKVVIQLPTP